MEIPRFSRVGNTLAENRAILCRAALALSIGALVKVVVDRLPAAQQAAAKVAFEQQSDVLAIGASWQELTEADFLEPAA